MANGIKKVLAAAATINQAKAAKKQPTIGDLQTATQDKFLTDYENARNKGDRTAMQRITALHPGDARVNVPLRPMVQLPKRRLF